MFIDLTKPDLQVVSIKKKALFASETVVPARNPRKTAKNQKTSSKNATGTEGVLVLFEQAIKVFVGNKVGSTTGNILS